MARNERLRAMVISAAMGALALVLPVVFHAVGLGSKFLPMLLPLLLNGFLSPPGWAMLTGAIVPWISALATGMPPLYPPVAAVMSLEGAALGLCASLLSHRRVPLWLSVPAAVAAGRGVMFAATWAAAKTFDLPPAFAATAFLVQGLPGVALQLAVVPAAVAAWRRREGPLSEGS